MMRNKLQLITCSMHAFNELIILITVFIYDLESFYPRTFRGLLVFEIIDPRSTITAMHCWYMIKIRVKIKHVYTHVVRKFY